MRLQHTAAGAILVAAVLAGCGGGDDDYHFVDPAGGLRLLAARSDPPEAKAGQSVTLTAFAYPIPAAGAPPLDIQWAACTIAPPPGLSLINDDCFSADTASYLVPFGAGATVTATVPDVAIDALGYPDATFGFYLPIRIRIRAGGALLDGVYRLRISPDPRVPPNHNPTLDGVFQVGVDPDGGATNPISIEESAPVPVAAGDRLDLSATFTDASSEDYFVPSDLEHPDDITKIRQVSEVLDVSWFSTAGHFSDGSTGSGVPTHLNLARNPPHPGDTVDLWAVGRDGRGGVDLMHRSLLVH